MPLHAVAVASMEIQRSILIINCVSSHLMADHVSCGSFCKYSNLLFYNPKLKPAAIISGAHDHNPAATLGHGRTRHSPKGWPPWPYVVKGTGYMIS